MSLNSHIYYILERTFIVKHMILKKGKVSHTNICFIPTCLETANIKPKVGHKPNMALGYVQLPPHIESTFQIQEAHAEVQASPRTKSGCPLAHPTVWSACRGHLFCVGHVFLGLPVSTGFFTYSGHQLSIHKHLSFQFFIDNLF